MKPRRYLLTVLTLGILGLAIGAEAQVDPRPHPRPGPHPRPRPEIQRMNVVCKSNAYRLKYCGLPPQTDIVDVRLVRQLNESRCDEGYSWGRTEDMIWVDHGCQGYFEVSFYPRDSRDPRNREKVENMFCKSSGYRFRSCAPTTLRVINYVQLMDARNDSNCEEGYSWGYDRRAVWVDHGCQGVFRLYGY